MQVPLRPAVVVQVAVKFSGDRQQVNARARASPCWIGVLAVPPAGIMRVRICYANSIGVVADSTDFGMGAHAKWMWCASWICGRNTRAGALLSRGNGCGCRLDLCANIASTVVVPRVVLGVRRRQCGAVFVVDVWLVKIPLESLTKRFLPHMSQVFRPRDLLCHTRC
jgi:hypothetical protein